MSKEESTLMSPERQHIEAFRTKRMRMSQDSLNREDFAESLQQIATGLYKAKEHFIFELIQNADDNKYAHGCVPRLSFVVKQVADNKRPDLVVTNNEIGFTGEHVEGICRVGKTTKKNKAIYIGEKGIGFKSVFSVTHRPQIHSNGYHFSLPDKEHDTKANLGFVVPYWVDAIPESVTSKGTTILLPLKADCTEMICKHLKGFSPETIIFLRKLKSIEIVLDVGEYHANVEIERQRKKIKDREISLTVLSGADVPTYRYWMARKRYKVELADIPDERSSITHREVTVAIPLDVTEKYPGKLFAYLPVDEHTGMPFLVNADFLLAASREQLKETPWNDWLKSCIAPVYAHAFLTGIRSRLPIEDKARLYASLPCNDTRYTSVSARIKELLKESECVLTVSGNTELPERCRRFKPEQKGWRRLLTDGGDTPTALSSVFMIVHHQIERYGNQLKYLDVPLFQDSDIYRSLQDAEWIGKRPIDWFVRLYQELDAKFGDLKALPILPVVMFDGGQRTCRCADGLHIYSRLTDEDRNEIHAFPQWARGSMPIASLDPELLDLIEAKSEEAQKKINELFKVMGIKEAFSIDEYASHVIKTLGSKASELTKDQVFELTDYLLQRKWEKVNWNDLPVVLAEGQIMRVEDAKRCRPAGLVVPEGYDPEAGWQHIWQQADDRMHFLALDTAYIERKSFIEHIKPHHYPAPVLCEVRNSKECVSEVERACWKKAEEKDPSVKHKHVKLDAYRLPMISLDPQAGHALLAWLASLPIKETPIELGKHLFEGCKIGIRFHYKDRNQRLDKKYYERASVIEWLKTNAWLPTTKGVRVPSDAYLKRPDIEEIFGDRVAYFDGTLPPGTIMYLGIKTQITAETLIDELKRQTGRPDADVELLRRIYGQLKDRSPSVKADVFPGEPIAVSNGNAGVTWHTVSRCVWEDASDSLGDDFCYLEKCYPDLKSFFVGVLGVKERVDADLYLGKLADLSRQQSQEIEPAKRLYRHLKHATLTDSQKSQLRDGSLLATRTKGSAVRWHKAEKCVWDCDEELFGDALGCLKKSFGDEDRQFFVETLGVQERPKLNHYLDCWLRCQKLPDSEQKAKREQVEKLYFEIGKRSSEWNSEPFSTFFKSAHVYTRRSVFRPGREVFWPDDGQLSEVFNNSVEYAWLPDNVAYVSWRDFLGKAEVKPLSQCAKSQLISELHQAPVAETNCFLTPAAVQMIATCIWQIYPEAYKCKWDQGVFERLARTREVKADQPIVVLYQLGTHDEKRDSSAYWDVQNCRLYLRETDGKSLRSELATHLALLLANKSDEDSFETYLGEESLQRLVKKRWKLPDEIRDLFGKNSADPGSEHGHAGLVADVVAASQPQESQLAGSPKTQQPATVTGGGGLPDSSRQTPVTPSTKPPAIPAPSRRTESPMHANEASAPGVRFNPFVDNPGCEAPEPSDDEGDSGGIRNWEHFIRVVTKDMQELCNAEPHPDERRRPYESNRLEPADEQVRAELLDYYHGKCQICQQTFPKRDGEPYFVAAHYVRRATGRYADTFLNSICLCADHFAKWQYAAKVFDPENKGRMLEIDPITGGAVIRVRLADQDETIKYVPAHYAKLQALYREAGPRQETGSADQEPQADSGACDEHSGL